MKDIGKKLMDIARWYSMPADHFNTIKEAVKLLEKIELKPSYNSIKTELNDDAISIQALKDLGAECIAKRDENGNLIPLGSIDSLSYVSCTETPNRCGDTISRQAAIDAIENEQMKIMRSDWDIDQAKFSAMSEIRALIADLPSISTEKTGRWEWVQYDGNPNIGNWHCSECRSVVIECVDKNKKGGIPLYKYCPQCGAKMAESEDKE